MYRNPFSTHTQVERLRSHLVSIEEGYTADLLQSEEREKELRNRLAVAEEKAASTSTAVQHARFVNHNITSINGVNRGLSVLLLESFGTGKMI